MTSPSGATPCLVALEVDDQQLLDREHRVRIEIGRAGHEQMRRDRLVALRRDDHVDVPRPVGMAPHLVQHPADRAVGRHRVKGRPDRAEPVAALSIGPELAAAEHLGLARDLHIVSALAVARPDIEQPARDRLALERQQAPGIEGGLAPDPVRDVGAERQFGRALLIVGPEHGRLDRPGRQRMVDRIDQDRDAQRVREQDELLALVGARLPDLGQEPDRGHPLRLAQLDVAHEGVQMRDQRAHDPLEARVLALGQPLDHGIGQGRFAELPHAASPRQDAPSLPTAGGGPWIRARLYRACEARPTPPRRDRRGTERGAPRFPDRQSALMLAPMRARPDAGSPGAPARQGRERRGRKRQGERMTGAAAA